MLTRGLVGNPGAKRHTDETSSKGREHGKLRRELDSKSRRLRTTKHTDPSLRASATQFQGHPKTNIRIPTVDENRSTNKGVIRLVSDLADAGLDDTMMKMSFLNNAAHDADETPRFAEMECSHIEFITQILV